MGYKDDESIVEIVEGIDESQLPSIITEQFETLHQLRLKVADSTEKAAFAKNSAQSASEKSSGILQRKGTIESLQTAQVDLADAQMSASEAQKVSFEYQKKLGEMTRYLLGLGISNITMNRTIVREIEMRLRGATEEELDELAKKELLGVVRQLKAQEDIMKKQGDLSKKVRRHESRLQEISIRENEQDAELKRQAAVDDEHDELLEAVERKNEAQDKEIARQAEVDKAHDKMIAEGQSIDKAQDAELKRQARKDEEHDKLLARISQVNKEQDTLLAQQAKKADERALQLEELQAQGKKQDQQILELLEIKRKQEKLLGEIIEINETQEEKIATLERRCGELEKQIDSQGITQTDNYTDLKNVIESKFSRNAGIVSLIIGIVAMAIALIQFFV